MPTGQRIDMDPRIADFFVNAWGQSSPIAPATLQALNSALSRVAKKDSRVRVHRVSQGPLDIDVTHECFEWQLILDPQCVQRVQTSGMVEKGPLHLTVPLGYHRLQIRSGEHTQNWTLIGVPDTCHVPPFMAGQQRVWGVALQLYSLRSARNWGVGDFGDLLRVIEQAAAHGADVIGLNPLHALYPQNPGHISPYSPSHREFLNWLYIDVTALPEWQQDLVMQAEFASAAFQQKLAAARDCALVDYPAVAALKRPVLEKLFAQFETQASKERQQAFADYLSRSNDDLHRICLFDALHEHLAKQNGFVQAWQDWPAEYRHPDTESCQQFARQHPQRLQFFAWIQWLAEGQLESAQALAKKCGMRIGLYRDLAVGADRGGSEMWSTPEQFCADISVGAPPDPVALQGQNWGLPPFHPDALQQDSYKRFIAMLRANMQSCGALRIDHVMAIFRLWWIPPRCTGCDGAYVHYPYEDMAGIIALESQRNKCLIIGEDLGTVPNEIRELMQRTQMLSYRILMFEQHADGLKAPTEYPPLALATISTHDMATLPGFWECEDLKLRERIGLYEREEQKRAHYDQRHGDKHKLLDALQSQQLFPKNDVDLPGYSDDLMLAAHRYLARCPSLVLMCQPEDWLGERHQVNLPGTSVEHTNWQRKIALPVEHMFDVESAQKLFAAIKLERRA